MIRRLCRLRRHRLGAWQPRVASSISVRFYWQERACACGLRFETKTWDAAPNREVSA